MCSTCVRQVSSATAARSSSRCRPPTTAAHPRSSSDVRPTGLGHRAVLCARTRCASPNSARFSGGSFPRLVPELLGLGKSDRADDQLVHRADVDLPLRHGGTDLLQGSDLRGVDLIAAAEPDARRADPTRVPTVPAVVCGPVPRRAGLERFRMLLGIPPGSTTRPIQSPSTSPSTTATAEASQVPQNHAGDRRRFANGVVRSRTVSHDESLSPDVVLSGGCGGRLHGRCHPSRGACDDSCSP